jgi:hypothetical protein
MHEYVLGWMGGTKQNVIALYNLAFSQIKLEQKFGFSFFMVC